MFVFLGLLFLLLFLFDFLLFLVAIILALFLLFPVLIEHRYRVRAPACKPAHIPRTSRNSYLVLFFLFGPLLSLLFLCFLVFREDEIAEFVAHINHLLCPARLASMENAVALDFIFRLWKSAVWAKNELFNVTVHQILKRPVGVCTIYDGFVRLCVIAGQRTKFRSEKLVHFPRRSVETIPNIGNVWNNCLDAIARPFNFAKHRRHFVTVFWVVHRRCPGNVDDLSATIDHVDNPTANKRK
jgi:hypothetical protein